MRRVLGTIAIVLCARTGILAAPQKPIEPTHTQKCTLATLKGRYLFGGIATLVPPASEGQALLAVAGYHVFNGDGTGKDFVAASVNGQSIERQLSEPDRSVFDITYTVNADCSGTYTVADGASFGLFVAPDGEELIVFGTMRGFVLVQGPNRRVSPK